MGIIKIYEEFINNGLLNKFETIKDKWRDDILVESDPEILYNSKYYREIISLGENVVPILINDLNTEYGDWFEALRQITKTDPVEISNRGNVINMTKDWVKWYKENYV